MMLKVLTSDSYHLSATAVLRLNDDPPPCLHPRPHPVDTPNPPPAISHPLRNPPPSHFRTEYDQAGQEEGKGQGREEGDVEETIGGGRQDGESGGREREKDRA